MELDLKQQAQSQIPLIICGDAHLNNFGFYASPERQLLFGLNDFDEARIGNWESDLKRLLVSVALIGHLNQYDDKLMPRLLSQAAKSYRRGIKYAESLSLLQRFYTSYRATDLLQQVSDDTQMQEVLKKIMVRAPKNNNDKVLKKFTVLDDQGNLKFKEKPPRARHVKQAIEQEIIAGMHRYQQNAPMHLQIFLINFVITDIVRYSVGVGSFGTRCYLALLTGKDGSHLVLQIKEAQPIGEQLSLLTVSQASEQSVNEGKRIITAQKVLQTYSDPFLGSMRVGQRSYYVRQFRDMKDSIDVTKLDSPSFQAYAEICALMLAISHYRNPTAPMIYGYLKASKNFDEAMANWAMAYAKQVHQDYAAFAEFLENGA